MFLSIDVASLRRKKDVVFEWRGVVAGDCAYGVTGFVDDLFSFSLL